MGETIGEVMNTAAFSVEISNDIPPETLDWGAYRPFQFLYGSIATVDNSWGTDIVGEFALQLCKVMQKSAVYSWNGAGFGFPIMSDMTNDPVAWSRWALEHYDIMFEFFCRHGYALSLANVLRGYDLMPEAKRLEEGNDLIHTWYVDGEIDKVAEHSRFKSEMILRVVKSIEAGGGLVWLTKSGKRKMELMDKFLTVEECLKLPEPYVPWIPEPWSRDKFVGWMNVSQNRTD